MIHSAESGGGEQTIGPAWHSPKVLHPFHNALSAGGVTEAVRSPVIVNLSVVSSSLVLKRSDIYVGFRLLPTRIWQGPLGWPRGGWP